MALLEAGRPQSVSAFSEHSSPAELPFRNVSPATIRRTRPVQKDCYACTECNYDWFCNDLEEPYTTADGKPFSWQGRTRVVGGRTNVWGRQSYRLGDLDFKAASRDGFGEDWPLSYADLAPYYDLVEDYVGISGLAEGLPELPDSRFHPAMPFTCAETRLRQRVKAKLGRTVTIGRVANITQTAERPRALPLLRARASAAASRTPTSTRRSPRWPTRVATGRCTLVPNAMVYKVLTDPDTNRAKGLLYVDRVTREPREVLGKAVVLCAQALESARILLNSGTPRNPGGLGNSSGVLGHYLMDHLWVAGGATGEFPGLGARPTPDGPKRPNGIYVDPLPQHERTALEGLPARLRVPGRRPATTAFDLQAPGFGEAYKTRGARAARRRSASWASASACRTSRTSSRSTRRARSTPGASRC